MNHEQSNDNFSSTDELHSRPGPNEEHQEGDLIAVEEGEGADLVSEEGQPQKVESQSQAAPRKVSAQVEALRKKFAQAPSIERVEGYLSFMKQQITPPSINFRDFWDARRDLSSSFRGLEDATTKTIYLEKVQALCSEAKGLKTVLDEQSQFAVEQIELAIAGIAQEIEQVLASELYWESEASNSAGGFDKAFYGSCQGKLNWLNSFSSRVGALRKELMKTEMRVRSKNKLFGSLSVLGDKIFPLRKELIREISERFISDVEHFTQDVLSASNLHVLATKAQVKAWQSIAKELTLNTHAFKKSRELLSQAWEQLKKLDKEFQQHKMAKAKEKKENLFHLQQQIDEAKKQHEAGSIPERVFVSKLDDVVRKLKKTDLLREDVDLVRNQIRALKAPIVEKEEAAQAEALSKSQATTRQHELLVNAITQRFEENLKLGNVDLVPAMNQELRQLQEKITLSHGQLQKLMQIIRNLQNMGFEKEIEVLLEKAQNVQASEASEVLRELFDMRVRLRALFEEHKRQAGASGMDFQKAMLMSERAKFEKERIEKLEHAISRVQSL